MAESVVGRRIEPIEQSIDPSQPEVLVFSIGSKNQHDIIKVT